MREAVGDDIQRLLCLQQSVGLQLKLWCSFLQLLQLHRVQTLRLIQLQTNRQSVSHSYL